MPRRRAGLQNRLRSVRFRGDSLDFKIKACYNLDMRFGPEKEVEIFKALAQKSTYQVGLDFGFDKVYKDARAVRNAVNAIFNKVRNNHETYGVSKDVIEVVEKGMVERKASVVGVSMREKEETVDIKSLVSGIRDKTFTLIDKKLDRVSNNKKKLDEISFKELGIIAGIAFDKSQILKGEATENIAVLAKIDTNISPEEAIKLALAARENNVDVNSGRG
jgi:hypothetical protein